MESGYGNGCDRANTKRKKGKSELCYVLRRFPGFLGEEKNITFYYYAPNILFQVLVLHSRISSAFLYIFLMENR